jgi:hypothetical protein
MNAEKHSGVGTKRSEVEAAHDVRLSAARKRLAESKDQKDALEGLREIVATFIGSEEIGLFRVDRKNATFKACWAFGIDLANYDLPRALGEAGLRRVMRGESYVASTVHDRFSAVNKAQAFVPINVADQTVAILAILRLLPQKHGFDHSDMKLFKLLSDEAAEPLFGSSAQSQHGIDGAEIRP